MPGLTPLEPSPAIAGAVTEEPLGLRYAWQSVRNTTPRVWGHAQRLAAKRMSRIQDTCIGGFEAHLEHETREEGMKHIFLAASLSISAWIGTAHAGTVVDTGEPPGLGWGGSTLATYQFLAGRFTTTEEFKVTELSAFVGNYSCCSPIKQEMTLSIASGPLDPLGATFTRLVSEETSLTLGSATAEWASATVADYLLSPGTYWIIASVEPGQVSIGLAMPWGAPNPLDAPAFWGDTSLDPGNYMWRPNPENHAHGFRIEGDLVQSVPEPGGLALMGLGLAAILVHIRRSRPVA